MGKKDRKSELQSTTQAASSVVVKASSGDTIDQSPFSFLFSDANPFKRKHQEVGQGFGDPVCSIESNADEGSAKVEAKKRKVVEEVLDIPSEKTKSKKEKRKDLDSAVSASKKESRKLKGKSEPESSTLLEVEEAAASELELQTKKLNKEEKNQEKSNKMDKDKKKRKRDELEAAYESKKYGADKDVSKEEEAPEPKTAGKKRKKTDSPEDMMVSKEGFDDESKLLRTVFVGNLPLKIKKKALLKEFSQFGEVESVRIRSVPIADVSCLNSS